MTSTPSPRRCSLLVLILPCLLALPPSALAAVGGPDGFGYTWRDGDEAGLDYAWEDISATGTDLGISAAIRATLVGAGSPGHDPSFQFGVAVAGPALAGFSRWVADSTAALGAAHTHCLLREGATIAEQGSAPIRGRVVPASQGS